MNTTTLRIEILIIGFQSTLWLLLIFDLSMNDASAFLNEVSEVEILATVTFIAWCYSIGAVIDGLTAFLENAWHKKLTFRFSEDEHVKEWGDSSYFYLKFPEASESFSQNDYSLRLLRSTAFNLFVLAATMELVKTQTLPAVTLFFTATGVLIVWYRRKIRSEARRKRVYKAAAKLNEMTG